jgi:recombination protein RecA
VAKSKTNKEEVAEETKSVESATFGFFSQAINDVEKGLRCIAGSDMIDPDPNKSGSYSLDYDLVVPFPEGRITEVYGEEGTCKTTLTLEVAGGAIGRGKTVLYVNMEKNLNLSLMKTIRSLRPFIEEAVERTKGKKTDCPLWIVNAANGEQALETMRKFASMVPGGVAILDSIDAAQPDAVLSGEIGENKMGNLGKLMSDAMRKLVGVAEANKVSLIFVNQLRDKITMYGDPSETPGGKAVRFYASQRIRLKKPRKADMIMNAQGEKLGLVINYVVIKNKFAPDGNEGAFPILFKNGIFREQELVTQCCNFGILRLGGKGGQQTYLPKLDRVTGEFMKKSDGELDGTWMKQFDAARRLLLDPALVTKLDGQLSEILKVNRQDAVDTMIDEVQDPE